jgi:hypothetical protein
VRHLPVKEGQMLFRIFNGTSRGLGEGGKGRDIYAQIGVEFRDYLKHFKGAKFGVFMCLLLHSDEDGWSFPGLELIASETGYTISEIKDTITELCRLVIEGQRVLFAMQEKEQGRFKHNKYLVFPTAEEIDRYAAYERRPRKKTGKQGTSPRPGKPSTEKPYTENWPLSRTSTKENHSKEKHRAAASLVVVAATQATAANPAANDGSDQTIASTGERTGNANHSNDLNSSDTPFQVLPHKNATGRPVAAEIKKPRLELAPDLLKAAHELLRDFYGVTYKASRDRIITNLASRPDLMLRVIRQYGDEIQANHRLDDHYNCAGALVRVLCDLDMKIFVTGMTGST